MSSARFALVIILVLLAGKYRDTIQVIPALLGFSMYQVQTPDPASLEHWVRHLHRRWDLLKL